MKIQAAIWKCSWFLNQYSNFDLVNKSLSLSVLNDKPISGTTAGPVSSK